MGDCTEKYTVYRDGILTEVIPCSREDSHDRREDHHGVDSQRKKHSWRVGGSFPLANNVASPSVADHPDGYGVSGR